MPPGTTQMVNGADCNRTSRRSAACAGIDITAIRTMTDVQALMWDLMLPRLCKRVAVSPPLQFSARVEAKIRSDTNAIGVLLEHNA